MKRCILSIGQTWRHWCLCVRTPQGHDERHLTLSNQSPLPESMLEYKLVNLEEKEAKIIPMSLCCDEVLFRWENLRSEVVPYFLVVCVGVSRVCP